MKKYDAGALGRLEAQLEAVNKKLDILIRQSSHKPVEKSFDAGKGYEGKSGKMQYRATCSQCGKSCGVPFKPAAGRPVFCADCFLKQQGPGDSEPRTHKKPVDFRRPVPGKKPFFKKG